MTGLPSSETVVSSSSRRSRAEDLAVALSTQAGVTIPVDLESLGAFMGVSRITKERMVEDGRLRWFDGAPSIALNSDRPEVRQRFTLAHELAHILLAKNAIGVSFRTAVTQHSEQSERMCDAIAASILMPNSIVTEQIASADGLIDLRLLRAIASRCRVSMSAAASRVSEVIDETCWLIRWNRSEGKWTCVFRAGLPYEFASSRIELTNETELTLSRLSLSLTSWKELTIVIDNARMNSRCQISRDRSGCLMLIRQLSPLT